MQSETRNCQNCKQSFVIEPEDFDFYEKIKVPPPTFCWECRMQRRLSFRNENVLYRRKCDATNKDILSIYSAEKKLKIYERDYWWSDKHDGRKYGRDYDFSKPFFAQWKELSESAPRPNLLQTNTVNSDYSNYVLNIKDSYMVFSAETGENLMYCIGSNVYCKDSMDLLFCLSVERSYGLVDCTGCTSLIMSRNCENCLDSVFLFDCRNCSNCLGCVGLRNKSYYIFNEPHTKEEYVKRISELNLGSLRGFCDARKRWDALLSKMPRRYAQIFNSPGCTGDDIMNAKNCRWCFYAKRNVENCRYGFRILDMKDGLDLLAAWNKSELFYEVASAYGRNVAFSSLAWNVFDVRYSDNCFNSSDIFGCVGLKGARFCILNKQYTEDEYRKMTPKIIEHMNAMPYTDRGGRVYRYGEFFPIELSPFAYNESLAQQFFTLKEGDIISYGYPWKDTETKNYGITKKSKDIPDNIKDVDDSITSEIIGCDHGGSCAHQCTTAFKIIPEELKFYRRKSLPVPQLCPNCRHFERLAQRNTMKLWHRQCQCAGAKSENGVYQNTARHFHENGRCPNEFETSYAPDRKEIVYCEQCYQSEVV
jgi:hypothetical protein